MTRAPLLLLLYEYSMTNEYVRTMLCWSCTTTPTDPFTHDCTRKYNAHPVSDHNPTCLLKQDRNTLSMVRAPDTLCNDRRDVHDLELAL